METKSRLLGEILSAEAKEAEWGAKASRLRKRYCSKYAPHKKDDKVLFGKYGSDAVIKGVVSMVKYSNGGFRYQVRECTKNWEYRSRRNPIWTERTDAIKKATP